MPPPYPALPPSPPDVPASPVPDPGIPDPTPPAPPRLELRGVGCRLGGVRILDDVDLALAGGEIVGLLGDSGCGKSTLLRVVAGLERPDRGEIRLDGRPLSPALPPEARGIGMVFQDYALFPHLTAAENVRFGLGRRGRAEARRIAAERLDQVGLGHRGGSYPATLSGGEAQRVALARALAPGPRVLLLDEPFSNLDRRGRERVRADTVALLRRAGATALLVTHDPEEALASCDRIALMRGGRILQVGTGPDLYGRPASPFVARFFAEPLAELRGRCRAGRLDTPLGSLPAAHPDGTPMVALLRAGAVRLVGPGEGCAARVVAREFLGSHARLGLRVHGLPEVLRLPVPLDDRHAANAEAGLILSGGDAFIFVCDRD